MARSAKIYLVFSDIHNAFPMATFTVKHECFSWISHYRVFHDGSKYNPRFWVLSMPDGGSYDYRDGEMLAVTSDYVEVWKGTVDDIPA